MKKTLLAACLALASLLAYMPTTTAAATVTASVGSTPATDATKPQATDKSHGAQLTIKADSDSEKGTDSDTDTDTDTDTNTDKGTDKKDKDDRDNALVAIGHDATLASDKHASTVVSVLGSSTSAGQVDDAVVSVLGNTRVTGPVGDAAVAVFGSTYVDSRVGDSVVAVFGNVELGPHADVQGDVVAVGGDLIRDPGAVVHGDIQNVMLFGHMGDYEWLRTWVHNCLMYGRPLAFVPGLGWAWTLAISFLVVYLLIAVLFPSGVNQCVRTMESEPGRTTLAALFTFVGKPIVFLVLLITVIGSILIPFLGFALFMGGLFGKAVALAWFGRRVLPARESGHEYPPVLAVLVGGTIALMLYVVPVLGFLAYKAFDVLGLGIVVYTLLLALRARRASSGSTQVPAAAPQAAVLGAPGEPAASAEAPFANAQPAPTPTPAAPPPAVSLALANRAGFWIRMLALLLDLVLVAIVCGVVRLPMHHGLLLILASYGAVMWKIKSTTIGGIVCGLRVARLDGRPIDWPTAVTRALGSFLSFFIVGLGFIWVVFDPERQSWHDKIAGTVVVHTPRGTPLV
jgi:uncharacterized RDD family membrane protein YckC